MRCILFDELKRLILLYFIQEFMYISDDKIIHDA